MSPTRIRPVAYSVFARTSKLTGPIKHKYYRLNDEKPVEFDLATVMSWPCRPDERIEAAVMRPWAETVVVLRSQRQFLEGTV